jgi:DNA-binding transcriptional LysR family regulator
MNGAIELRHLTALKALADEGSFGRAARRLGYTQSAISQQIAALERAVGHRLVDRPGGPRPVALTEPGTLLLRHAEAIMARLQAAEADLAALAKGGAGIVRVGAYQSVRTRILPGLMRRLLPARPQLEIELTESGDDGELLQMVEQGELDLAFVMLPLQSGPFEAIELIRDPYVLVVQAGSPLAARRTAPSLRDIGNLPLIGHRYSSTCQLRVEATLRSTGVEPRILFRSDDNGTVQGLVAAGMGYALVPLLTVDPKDEDVTALPLGPEIPPRVIGLAWHRDRYRSPAVEAFLAEAIAFCGELADARPRRHGAKASLESA